MTEPMTKAKQGLVGSLLTGPAATRLAEEAGKFAAAKAERLTKRMTGAAASGLTGHSGKRNSGKGNSGSSGNGGSAGNGGGQPKLAAVVEGAKSVVEGESKPAAMVRSAGAALKEKVKSVFGGIGAKTGELKMTNIEEAIDIGLPVDVVYDQWTQLDEFPHFMKGVENIDQENETESNWHVKVAFSRRSWKARITEQIPDRRIVWTSEGEKGHTQGSVTFHALADDLTRVLLSMEYYPAGFFEKTGNIWRAGGRRARLDLKHFRRFITLSGEATGSWRGEIRDGEVVKGPEEDGEKPDRSAQPQAEERREDAESDQGAEPQEEAETQQEEETREPATQAAG